MPLCLVVDDSRVIRKVARRILEDLGFIVDEAEDGLSGVDRCKAGRPDAVLVDAVMPNLDGIGFMKTVKREMQNHAPKMVFCTTENEETHIVSARAAGASEILLKPFDKETLEAQLISAGVIQR